MFKILITTKFVGEVNCAENGYLPISGVTKVIVDFHSEEAALIGKELMDSYIPMYGMTRETVLLFRRKL